MKCTFRNKTLHVEFSSLTFLIDSEEKYVAHIYVSNFDYTKSSKKQHSYI